MSRMRFITDLHLRHAGEPIWIAGTDTSLDDYPDDFFENKIGITLHLAHLKFPRATYRYFNEYDRVEFLLREDPGSCAEHAPPLLPAMVDLSASAQGVPGEAHFSTAVEIDRRMRPGIRSFSDPVKNVPMLEQTLALIDACAREGIRVNWIRGFAGGSLEAMSVDMEELIGLKRAITRPVTATRRIKSLIKTAVYPAINRFR